MSSPVLIMPARQLQDPATAERNNRRHESVARAGRFLPVSSTIWLEDSIHDVPVQRPELVVGIIAEHIQQNFFG